jgi:hypothetical protein
LRHDVARDVGRQSLGELAELEQLHVEVARRAGDPLQLPEAVAKDAQRLGREDAAQLALQRARAAHRHAQVVQELAVDVPKRAGQVELDDLVQAAQDLHRGGVGALAGVELEAQLRGGAAGDPACRLDGVELDRPWRLAEPERAGQQRQQPRELAVVAEHADDVQARAQRDRVAGAGDRRRLLDAQSHDDLADVVEHVERQLAAAHADDRRHGAHLDQRLEPLAQGCRGGKVAGQQPRGTALVDLGGVLGVRRRIGQREPTGGRDQRHAGAVQAPVERVPEGALDRVRLVRDDRKLSRERVGDGGRRQAVREQQLTALGAHGDSLPSPGFAGHLAATNVVAPARVKALRLG